MMRLSKISSVVTQAVVLSFFMVKMAIAEDVNIIGSLQHRIKNTITMALRQDQPEKEIRLLHVQLSAEEKELLAARAKDALAHRDPYAAASYSSEYPSQVQVGMNEVPVLDQGRHGTCVTFALTAALDAAIGKGDYISQLCSLQLGNYLEQHGYGDSGWDGAFPINVIQQIEQYGVVNKEHQKTKGCGGLTEYPAETKGSPTSYIEPKDFKLMSEPIFGELVNWYNIFWTISSSWTLSEVKKSLNSQDRVIFAVLFPRVDLGTVGAIGSNKGNNDTWVLTPEIIADISNTEAAHEMIITGYDDNAIAIDDKGKQHKGLLTLRNSWGSKYGDNGNFYMSYDYFKTLTFDARRLSPN